MQKRCPRPGCNTMLRMAAKVQQTGSTKKMLGTASNPVVLRCTTCRKSFEFKSGRLTELKGGR
jgi:hypothetical protein